jgi:hypothetical protein
VDPNRVDANRATRAERPVDRPEKDNSLVDVLKLLLEKGYSRDKAQKPPDYIISQFASSRAKSISTIG